MHTSWGSNPISFLNISCIHFVVDPNDLSSWKTNIFRLGTLCYHEKCRGFGYSLTIFSIWYLQSCVDLGLWYNLGNLFSCHTCVCFVGLFGVLSKLYLVWFLKVLCMHMYYMYILWHAFFRWYNVTSQILEARKT